jgi:hypothetical protein
MNDANSSQTIRRGMTAVQDSVLGSTEITLARSQAQRGVMV